MECPDVQSLSAKNVGCTFLSFFLSQKFSVFRLIGAGMVSAPANATAMAAEVKQRKEDLFHDHATTTSRDTCTSALARGAIRGNCGGALFPDG
jgi:hypothetical protein